MKQIDRIRNLPVADLAKLLIADTIIEDEDEDYEGNWELIYIQSYECPDGSICWDYDDALECTIEWLESEVVDEDISDT